jgi:hypothetical protein
MNMHKKIFTISKEDRKRTHQWIKTFLLSFVKKISRLKFFRIKNFKKQKLKKLEANFLNRKVIQKNVHEKDERIK